MKYTIIVILFLSIACAEKKTDSNNNEKNAKKVVSNDDLVMYEPSELATLMQEMYDANKNWKEEVLKGNIPKDFPKKYKTIHSAISTNENAGSDFFNAMASSYISSVDAFTNASSENVKEKYNNMVNVCVACHISVCPGPVGRIKKLLIK